MFAGLSLDWSWSIGGVLFFVVLALLYIWRLSQVRSFNTIEDQGDAERDRKRITEPAIKRRQIVAFFCGWALTALLVLSPINTIARTQLLSVHFAQAVLIASISAPLILYGCPAIILRPLFSTPIIRTLFKFITFPVVASLSFNICFLLWHLPKFYHASMTNADLYQLWILGVFVTSLLNWWPLIGSLKEIWSMSYPMQMLYAFFDGQPADIFALVLVFSGIAFYPQYAIPAQLHLTAFADQTVGGALLLIPGLVDLGVMSPFFFRWLRTIEERTRLADLQRQEEAENWNDEWDEDNDEEEYASLSETTTDRAR